MLGRQQQRFFAKIVRLAAEVSRAQIAVLLDRRIRTFLDRRLCDDVRKLARNSHAAMAGKARNFSDFRGRLSGSGKDRCVEVARHRHHGAGDLDPRRRLTIHARLHHARLAHGHARVTVFALDAKPCRNLLHVHHGVTAGPALGQRSGRFEDKRREE